VVGPLIFSAASLVPIVLCVLIADRLIKEEQDA
jgi:hypothetical protein